MVEQPDTALKLLNLEQAFLHGVEPRIHELDRIVDPRSGQQLTEFQLSEFSFGLHCRTDSQLAHQLLLRYGFTAHEIERVINSMPVNRAIAWQADISDRKLLREATWQPSGIIVAAVCWSPLQEIISSSNGCLKPGNASDVIRLIERMSFPMDSTVWLVVGSTTGWRKPLPRIIGSHVYCAYFEPAPLNGWMVSQTSTSVASDDDWATTHLHPETDQQLEARFNRWFEDYGRRIAMTAAGITVDTARDQAGVPEQIAEVFLIAVASEEPARWLYEPEKQRLVFLGP